MKRSGNHDRINKLLFPDRLNLLKNLIIKGAQALCRPWERGRPLVWGMKEKACCRKQQRKDQNCSKRIVVLKKHGSINEVWQLRFQIINRLTVLCERGRIGQV